MLHSLLDQISRIQLTCEIASDMFEAFILRLTVNVSILAGTDEDRCSILT